jgi:hypothetical protein
VGKKKKMHDSVTTQQRLLCKQDLGASVTPGPLDGDQTVDENLALKPCSKRLGGMLARLHLSHASIVVVILSLGSEARWAKSSHCRSCTGATVLTPNFWHRDWGNDGAAL